jgi:hypothetical protein
MNKLKPYLVTAAVVLVTLFVVKQVKPSLPAFVQNLLP